MERGTKAEILALIVVIGFLGFAGGYVVAGGIEKFKALYAVGENINPRVVVYDTDGSVIENSVVPLYSGMTVLDAVANVYEVRIDLTWPQYGPAVKTLDNKWFSLKVDGETPAVGFAAIQLTGDNIIELWIQ